MHYNWHPKEPSCKHCRKRYKSSLTENQLDMRMLTQKDNRLDNSSTKSKQIFDIFYKIYKSSLSPPLSWHDGHKDNVVIFDVVTDLLLQWVVESKSKHLVNVYSENPFLFKVFENRLDREDMSTRSSACHYYLFFCRTLLCHDLS